jgi:serine/threonine protein kinase
MSISQLLPLSAGTFIKDYEIIELLGSGGFGAVYKAKPRNGSSVAIKETYFGSERELKMFRDEANLLSSLSDEDFPKVITHFDNGNSRYYLIMELIEGDDLGDVLEKSKKPIDLKTVLDWADKILESLAYLHAKGIIHRDIKPQNLKLTPKGRIKIIDLGIAKDYFNKASSNNSVSSIGAATPFYAPIEQHLRLEENFVLMLMMCSEQKTNNVLAQGTDARADIYALGVTLYRLLTNTVPAISPNRALSVWSGKNDLIVPAHKVNKNIPLEISQFLHKAMEIERDNRYASVNEMRDALWKAFTTIKNKREQQQSAEFAKREAELLERERNLREREVHFKQLEPMQDWQQIEAARLQKEEAEAKRRQADIDEIERKLNEPKKDSKQIPVNRILATVTAVTLFIGGLFGVSYWVSDTPKVANTNINTVNTASVANNANNISNTANNSVAKVANNVANKVTNTTDNVISSNLTYGPFENSLPVESPSDYFKIGCDCTANKDYVCAISNYSKAIELNPNDACAFNNRGNAYNCKDIKGNCDLAINDYNEAIKLKPEYIIAYYNRGSSYDYKGNYDLAINDYSKAIVLNSRFVFAYNNRGNAYYNKGNYDAAIADYRKALKIIPYDEKAKNNLKLALAEKAKQ